MSPSPGQHQLQVVICLRVRKFTKVKSTASSWATCNLLTCFPWERLMDHQEWRLKLLEICIFLPFWGEVKGVISEIIRFINGLSCKLQAMSHSLYIRAPVGSAWRFPTACLMRGLTVFSFSAAHFDVPSFFTTLSQLSPTVNHPQRSLKWMRKTLSGWCWRESVITRNVAWSTQESALLALRIGITGATSKIPDYGSLWDLMFSAPGRGISRCA